MPELPDTVAGVNPTFETLTLPTARVGAINLFCSGPRRDGRFALHRTSPSESPFAYAWADGDGWTWALADGSRRGRADSLAACLSAAETI